MGASEEGNSDENDTIQHERSPSSFDRWQKLDRKPMTDNLIAINALFERREDSRHADGYTYFCKHCGMECNVKEVLFHCQDGRILPVYIKCRYGCGRSWHLEIHPIGKVSVQ